MAALATPEFSQQMGDKLRAAANTPDVKEPVAAVQLAVKELELRESEGDSILETFIKDGDYSKWGLASAVTSVANNDDTTYERACELEDVGAQVLELNLNQWTRFVEAEKVPVAA